MYASIRRYRSDSAEDVLRRVKQGFVPIISRTQGFIAYYSLNAGNGVLASVSTFETKEGAEASNRIAAEWVKGTIGPLLSGPPEITAGEVTVHAAR